MFFNLDKVAIIAFFKQVEPFFLWYFGLVNIWSMFLVILGSIKVYIRNSELKEEDFYISMQTNSMPEIALIMPCYNGEKYIVESARSLLNLSYQYKKIYLVNDGSTDGTLDCLIKEFQMVPIPKLYDEPILTKKVRGVYRSTIDEEVYLVDKEQGGKSDTSNAGINAIDTDYLLVIDADTFIEESGFEALIRPLFSTANFIGVGSSIRIKNGTTIEHTRVNTRNFPPSYLISLQGVEYLRSFLSRLGWDYFNANFIIAGAFSLFPRDIMVQIGGFADTVGEDAEITIRLHRVMKEMKKKYKIFYIPDAIAWTIAQEKMSGLAEQRIRWHLAILEALWFHKRMFFNPRYKFIGLLIYPFWIFGEALEPLIEIFGYIYIATFFYLGELHHPFVIAYFMISLGMIFVYTFFSIVTERLGFRKYPSLKSIFLLFSSSIVENIGYHQITLWWRLKSFFLFIKKYPKIRKEHKVIQAKIDKAKNP